MVTINKTNLFATLMLLSALFVSCSRSDNPIDPLSDDPVPEQPSDDQPGDDQPGDDQPGETAYLECPDGNHPHMIDLGLPSGTLWACCNVGATTPEGYGDYYAWGETSTKRDFDWDTYQYGSDMNNVVYLGSDIAGTKYDAATANWGAPWRMPSVEQCQELLDNTTEAGTTLNGVNGRTFTGPNGGAIFLPAAGGPVDGELMYAGLRGFYWSSSLDKESDYSADELSWWNADSYCSYASRFAGESVRPVRKN